MLYIEINPYTRLGNWMFEYAAAASTREFVCFYGTYEGWRRDIAPYADTIFRGAKLQDKKPKDLEVYHAPTFRYHKLPSFAGKNVDFRGYFQSEKFFNAELIRSLYGVPKSNRQYLLQKYGEWLNHSDVVGISVRRGDYLAKPEYHPFVGKRFLRKAVSLFPPSSKFVVCSDDLEWCKRFFTGNQYLFVSGETAMNQIYVHALCHHNIISNSSFSWWGAWLNEHKDKRVIAPSLWFGFGSKEDTADLLWDKVEILRNRYSIVQFLAGWKNIIIRSLKLALFPIYKRFCGR